MKEFTDSILLGDFARAFSRDFKLMGSPSFSCCPVVAQTKENSTIIGRFAGEIGLPLVHEFRQALHGLLVGNLDKVIVDLQDVSLTRTAVGALVDFAASVHGNGKRLYLYRPSGQIFDLLDELELTGFFRILESEDDILARLTV